MRRLPPILLALAPLAAGAQPPVLRDVAARPSLAEPSLSPDGREIAFVSGGDVWTVPAEGGEARLLVSHAANESRPLYSPDGRRLAFVSTRTGNGDVYVLELTGAAAGTLRRVTWDDAPETLDAWSRDGRWLYLSTSAADIAGMQDVHRVRADGAGGGTPMPVAADRYASEYWSAPSPDGRTLAITARGTVSGQWWRHGHSHLDESEIWLVTALDSAAPNYAPVTAGGAKSAWPMWAPDGNTVYFMSDRSGAENLWAQPLAGGKPEGAARQLTRFTDGRLVWPSAGADGRAIVFERDFGVWRYDVASGQARQVPITLRGAPAGMGTERIALGAGPGGAGVQEMALSPDGRKVAVIARGEVFAAAAKPEPNAPAAEAARVTTTPEPERELAWSPDSRRLAYVSERGGRRRIWVYDFAAREERAVTAGDGGGDVSPRWSPDGRSLAFVRGGREARVADVATAAATAPARDRLVARGAFGAPPFTDARTFAWSPDGQWLAYAVSTQPKEFTNVFLARAGADANPDAARQVSFLANAFGGNVSWSPDGTFLVFGTGQRTEPGRIARVDLVPRTPRFRETLFEQLFAPPGMPRDSVNVARPPAAPNRAPDSVAAGRDSARDSARDAARDAARGDSAGARRPGSRPPVRVAFENIRQRLQLLPLPGVEAQGAAISPDGRTLLVVASAAGQQNLWTVPLDELATDQTPKQLTSTAGGKQDPQWAPDSKEVYFREGGRVQAVNVDTRAVRAVPVTAELDVDFAREKEQVFRQAWTYLRDNFYDEKFHGADWDGVAGQWAPQVAGARTSDELRRVLSLMVGELNASHLGVNGPPAQQPFTGRLGLRFDRAAYERDGALRVTEVIPLGPADVAGVRAGDVITAVDGRAVGADANLQELLANRIGRRVTLALRGGGAAGGSRTVELRPAPLGTEKQLLYRAWVESRRAYVARVSNGRLGYVHMPDMSDVSLAQLYVDLDAENQGKDGVVIDIRNNNGGFVNAYALDVFARRPYLTMTSRGQGPAPARAQLGQRALERPTVLVTNQHSLSDAEDFTEGYRALGLGRVVGEPTSGWIIYTSNVGLVDGTILRIPSTRITGADGKDMERHPRPVDVPVTRPVGESYSGRDSQLDAAVRTLLSSVSASR